MLKGLCVCVCVCVCMGVRVYVYACVGVRTVLEGDSKNINVDTN